MDVRTEQTVRRAIEVARLVIDINERLAIYPRHAASAQQRIIDAEVRVAALEAELAAR